MDASHMISLFENATEGIILTNSSGNIILVNPAAEKTFGYAAAELINKPVEVLIPETVRERHVTLRDDFYKHPQDRVMGHGRDLYARKKDGIQFPVEVSLSHYNRDNQLFVIAFIIDITFRKQIEANMVQQQKELEKMAKDMRKLNTELEAKVEERTTILKEALMKLEQSQQELHEALDKERELSEIKSRFVSMASHEFRTPLSTVLSSASLIGKYTTTEDQGKRNKHINRIKESVKHLNDILEDFLSLGKLDEGKVIAHPGEFDLRELIHDTIEEMKGLLKKDQNIIYRQEGDPLIWSDKKLLKNILINLISNASKFSEEGSPIEVTSIALNARLPDGQGTARISVADKGIGIPSEDQEHLFSSFFRGKNAINIQGTGLGLHIVRRYIDLLGGDVHLQSELDKGTIISISIPITETI
jgi:PAS domain S-box-containing protein